MKYYNICYEMLHYVLWNATTGAMEFVHRLRALPHGRRLQFGVLSDRGDLKRSRNSLRAMVFLQQTKFTA